MAFNESNTVEAYLYDLLSGPAKPIAVNVAQEPESHYGRAHKGLGWRRIASADFPRQTQEVLVETWVRRIVLRKATSAAKCVMRCRMHFSSA